MTCGHTIIVKHVSTVFQEHLPKGVTPAPGTYFWHLKRAPGNVEPVALDEQQRRPCFVVRIQLHHVCPVAVVLYNVAGLPPCRLYDPGFENVVPVAQTYFVVVKVVASKRDAEGRVDRDRARQRRMDWAEGGGGTRDTL